ncbi:ATP-binding protein [Lactococcus petauri]|uniref:ATP-binding protein n=1 Tax=Lactococcus petauri TaxID=1940789 RepID=UPI0025511595|nr:ATP-binding protein [Lactococcus petauri]
MSEKDYTLDYAPTAVQHLGVGLYKQLPQSIAELITNAWDADAKEVLIKINYKKRIIIVSDNGHGMGYEELNNNFLKVAKNRRLEKNSNLSPKGRKLTGKKGLGKLALFGIANKIQVISRKDGFENGFEMDYLKIQNTPENERYHPKILSINKETDKKDGTDIIISDLTLVNITPMDKLALSLSKRFDKYSKDDFYVIISNEKNETIPLDETSFENSLKPVGAKIEFTYNFPQDFSQDIKTNKALKDLEDRGVTGKIFCKSTPLRADEQGFSILSHGKLASERNTKQFNDRANDNFYLYSVGYFDIDFIDDDIKNDYISTDRQSILWDSSEDLKKLREDLNKLVNSVIQRRWRKNRSEVKISKVEKAQKSNKIVKEVIDSPNITKTDKQTLHTVSNILESDSIKISAIDKDKVLEAVAKSSTGYQIDHSRYNDIIPKDFIVPKTISNKIWHLRNEAVTAAAGKVTPDHFILAQGLWLRALLDTTTSTLLVKYRLEINENGKIFRKQIQTDNEIYNLQLKDKYLYMLKFLDLKGKLSNSKSVNVYIGTFNNLLVIEHLNHSMHDDKKWPKSNDLKLIWEEVAPILKLAFEYIKNDQ